MTRSDKPRVVYSTGERRTCPKCGWPADRCVCAAGDDAGRGPVPERVIAKLRIEKGGRGGKTVTVIDGLPDNTVFLDALARELKRACGTGGTAGRGFVELQGDQREVLKELLAKRGFTVKG